MNWSILKSPLFVIFLFISLFSRAQFSEREFFGKWRGELEIRKGTFVPFNFEIRENGKVFLINADERFETGKFTVVKDSLFIPLDQFDNELAFRIINRSLAGELRKQDHTGLSIPVTAAKGRTDRFRHVSKTPPQKIGGKYDVTFQFESGKNEKSVAIFKQQGTKLTGTFLKPSGDARFLEGSVDGNKFYLSSFIGSSPGYYTGSVTDGKITGVQLGTKIRNPFSGTFNENATLEDPFSVSHMREGYSSLDFSFPDINDKPVSLKDEKYRNKVVIIAITGTWCPNCIDEAAFLAPWYKKNKERGVEIVTIHYERQSDSAFVHKVMNRFRNRFDIQYDQVFGGIANNDSVSKSLPSLASFKSFPTTIFIGKTGNVSKIHSGYSGPATGKYYDEFVKEFNEEVIKLLDE
jgi:thiol-disulfide isomerase/thioredoxin